jgi:hypothetical protein
MASRHDGRQTIKPPPVAEMIKAAVTNTPGLAKYVHNEAQLEELVLRTNQVSNPAQV